MSEVIQTGACPLIDALPVEIRIQIYESILFENGSFFSLDDEEGNSVPTLFPKLRAPPKRTDQQPVVEDGDPQGTGPGRGTGNIMALLLSNKQIYNEAASLLYSTSFFRLRGIRSTIQFINTVAPAHLALVRSLKLVWDDQGWASAPEYDTPTLRLAWPSLCDALATDFHGLRNLYVALGMPNSEAHIEQLYLGGLARVRHVENFKVCIPVGFLERYYGIGVGAEEDGTRGQGSDTRESLGEGESKEGEEGSALSPPSPPPPPYALCRHTACEVCDVRREVITAEWLGDSRPATPKLKVGVPNAPGLEPWADGEWESETGKDARASL